MGIWKGSITVPNDDDDNNNNWLNNMERGINALRVKKIREYIIGKNY